MLKKKQPHYSVRTFQKDPKETEFQGAILKICRVTWKQMFHVTKVVTASEQAWGNRVKKLTPSLSFSLIFFPPETKA